MTGPRLCACHGEPMQTNGTRWRCAIRRRSHVLSSAVRDAKRSRELRYYHNVRKHDPGYMLNKQLSEMLRVR